MKLKRGTALGVGLSLVAFIALPIVAHAAVVVSTPPTPKEQPLVISGFKRSVAAHSGAYIQLYNSGSELINLKNWKVKTNTTEHAPWQADSYMLPKTHVIISLNTSIANASYRTASPIDASALTATVEPSIESGYRGTSTAFPAYSLSDNEYDVWQRRTTTSGYSTATAPFDKTGIKTSAQFGALQLYDDGFYTVPQAPAVTIAEMYPYASDCSPHDTSVLCGDYVKLYNPTVAPVDLSDYVLRTDSSSASRTSSNTFSLDGVVIQPNEYLPVWQTDAGSRISLTNSGGYVWLEDVYGLKVYEPTTTSYPSAGSSQQGFAWARQDNGEWAWTSAPSPLSMNTFPVVASVQVDVFAECPAGKYRNPETNRCRTIEEAVNALATCPEGQYRNSETNRCRSTATIASASLTPCKEGQERNLATNRCRSIASAVAELIPCDEGYERNPATNRCRKSLATGGNPATTIASVGQAGASNTALPWVLAVVAAGAVGYGVYEWRHELKASGAKLLTRFKK